MKKLFIILLSLGLIYCAGYGVGAMWKKHKNKTVAEQIIGKPDIKVENGRLTPEILWAFGRLGEYAVSPDEQTIAFTVSYYDIAQNKGNAEIYLMDANGQNVRQLTKTAKSESNLAWCQSGQVIHYLYEGQVHEIDHETGDSEQLSDFETGIEGFTLSPDGTKMLYVATITNPKNQEKLFANTPLSTGRVIEDLSYRHWDGWVDEVPHLFVADFINDKISEGKDLLAGEPFEAPTRPWGGLEETTWSPDGTKIAYSCRKKTGKEYAFSTNTDIYLYDIASGKTANITEGMMGYDKNPRFSPDGSMIAWESMERDGYEADQIRLFTYNFNTKEYIYRTQNYDSDAMNLLWSKDGQTIYFLSPWHGRTNLCKVDLNTNEVSQISKENAEFTSLHWFGDKFIGAQMTMSRPSEIFEINTTGETKQLSQINTDLLAQLKFGKVEERWIKTTDNKDMLTWVIYPYNYDSTKAYPTLLFCGGGPQTMIGQSWSYRWNFQMMSAGEYVIVAPNRRGLPGFGKAWCEQISGDYGGQNMKDYFSAIDALAKEPFVDAARLGAAGASYGGFSVYWLAGHHNKRFKAFLAHNGMFNLEQQYLETEEMWFAHWDLGGAYWDKSNKIAQNTYANSPHKFVDKWDTPLCVIHSELDYRIVASQGMAAFNAAQIKGIPSRYLYFPDENHWVLRPQNSIVWHRNYLDWFDTFLK
ncbi:MAG: S9 family peptidase [Bacteroidales bacterium]|jgi:dipeptidyl aminopeptidase/acylaminoacyl peptidase|nr:S9 family peptidase [Bacteroidales bacterium]